MKEPSKKKLIERWENVLRVLQSLTPHQRKKHWDMDRFGYQTACGTVACAAGHCGLDPWFRKRGYKMEWSAGELFTPWDAEYKFFGYEGTEDIFYDPTPRPVGQVIREVRAHIKKLSSAGHPESPK